MYVSFDAPLKLKDQMPQWEANLIPYEEIIGYSNLGLIFLREPARAQYAIFQPLRGANSRLGQFSSCAEFRSQILEDPEVIKDFLRPNDIEKLRQRLGPLN